jgi:hypothetical protein
LGIPYQVDANDVVYTVVDDRTTVYWAVITGAVTDEIFGEFTAPGFAVELTRKDLGARTTEKGLYAITGYPERSFPVSATVVFVLTAPGFANFSMNVAVPAGGPFPVAAGAAAMRRLPLLIQGRVVNATTGAPIAGAFVESVDNPIGPPPAVHATVLRTPLYFSHASAPGVQPVTIAAGLGVGLQQAAVGGGKVLTLAARTGLVGGSIVRISTAADVQAEYGVVDLLGPGPDTAAGDVYLRNPIARTYAALGTAVSFVTATPVGGAIAMSSDAGAGDCVLLGPQLFTGTVGLDTGSPTIAEYHDVGAITDANGYYTLAGVGRVPEIFLKATKGPLTRTVSWFVEYDQATNVVDIRS